MRYQDLRVWQEASRLAVEVYRLTARLPSSERFGLISQMRQAARSVPANIAEGFGRRATGDFIRFLRIATGSLLELESDLALVAQMALVSEDLLAPVQRSVQCTARLLHALIQSATRRQRSQHKS